MTNPELQPSSPDRMLLTYVLRHSPDGMDVRSSNGHRCHVPPGGLLASSGVALHRAAQKRQTCLSVDLELPCAQGNGFFACLDDGCAKFVNSAQSCVRLLMGGWSGHQVMWNPLPGFWLLDLDLAPGEGWDMPACAERGAFAMLTSGSLNVDGRPVDRSERLLPRAGRRSLRLASDSGASVLMFSNAFGPVVRGSNGPW